MKRDLKYDLSDVSVTKRLWGACTLFVLTSIGMLAFRDGVPTDSNIIVLFSLGCMGIVLLTFLILKKLKELRNELIIRSSFIGQNEVDEKLTKLAVNLRLGSKIASDLQTEVSQAREPSLSLRERSESATTSFKGYQEIFFNLCKALEEAGYEVLKTAEGKYSIKLYWPKEEKTPPPPTEGPGVISGGSHFLVDEYNI
ncbi:MAG: hypothetical protein NUW02_01170 [Candidatus Campbellbacteria bacterium]|nr:hypothetical protein [Candidatus Campbellbacteria bacterium]